MIRLSDLETVMKPQFVWDRKGQKYFQVSEEFEGNKELARTIFVGLSDMFGFEATEVMTHINMGYDSYRHKLMQFRETYKEGLRRKADETLNSYDDNIKRMYIKTCLCLNAIKTATRKNPYLKMEEYINI
jgi:predicted SprT family Zn-dependent metalloprotease